MFIFADQNPFPLIPKIQHDENKNKNYNRLSSDAIVGVLLWTGQSLELCRERIHHLVRKRRGCNKLCD